MCMHRHPILYFLPLCLLSFLFLLFVGVYAPLKLWTAATLYNIRRPIIPYTYYVYVHYFICVYLIVSIWCSTYDAYDYSIYEVGYKQTKIGCILNYCVGLNILLLLHNIVFRFYNLFINIQVMILMHAILHDWIMRIQWNNYHWVQE